MNRGQFCCVVDMPKHRQFAEKKYVDLEELTCCHLQLLIMVLIVENVEECSSINQNVFSSEQIQTLERFSCPKV